MVMLPVVVGWRMNAFLAMPSPREHGPDSPAAPIRPEAAVVRNRGDLSGGFFTMGVGVLQRG